MSRLNASIDRVNGSQTLNPVEGCEVLRLTAFGGPVVVTVTGGLDGHSSLSRTVQLAAGDDFQVRTSRAITVRLDAKATGAKLAWAWSPLPAASGDGANLRSLPLVVGALTPVPAGAYEVEIYRSGLPGTFTWSVEVSPAVPLPAVTVPASPLRLYVGGTHYTSTVAGSAVWRLRAL